MEKEEHKIEQDLRRKLGSIYDKSKNESLSQLHHRHLQSHQNEFGASAQSAFS